MANSDYIRKLVKEADGDEEGGTEPSKKKVLEHADKLPPKPNDEAMHEWAEREGYNVPKTEAMMYSLARGFANFANHGKAKENDTTASDVPSKELSDGVKVEMEHTSNPDIAKRIALDHEAESPKKNYYEYLDKMEEKMKDGEKIAAFSLGFQVGYYSK